jgi:hypothetical protein
MTVMPRSPSRGAASWKWVLLSVVCAAGVWLYAQRVLIPYQKADAAAQDRPRGNLSDLYPRWLGARELLLRGRDPYSAEIAREIQMGYYGRALDPARPGDPRDLQGFAYPVYVVFVLAPTVRLPFAVVQQGFFWLLAILTAASALIWLRALRWAASFPERITVLALTMGSLAVMQGLKLEQMSLLVAGLIAIAILLLICDWQIAAGAVLALAAIKPQLIVLLLVWLGMWTLGDLRRRWRWAASFAVVMAIQMAAAEWYLPHWIPRFWQAAREYNAYTGAVGVAEKLAGPFVGRTLELLAVVVLMRLCWQKRRLDASDVAFARMISLVLALTVLLVPAYSVYNQVLLIPALVALFRERRAVWGRGFVGRALLLIGAGLIAWPWSTSVLLAVLSFLLPPATVERAWAVPFWTALLIPVGVAAMMLVYAGESSFDDSARAASS